jgi:hypothetical protein
MGPLFEKKRRSGTAWYVAHALVIPASAKEAAWWSLAMVAIRMDEAERTGRPWFARAILHEYWLRNGIEPPLPALPTEAEAP